VVAVQQGDEVRITAGLYRGFRGQVQDADSERARVSVVVPIFGRPTRLELEESQVERI